MLSRLLSFIASLFSGGTIGAVASAAEAAKEIVHDLNTPDIQQGRKDVGMQKAEDRISANAHKALETGDISGVQKDLQ